MVNDSEGKELVNTKQTPWGLCMSAFCFVWVSFVLLVFFWVFFVYFDFLLFVVFWFPGLERKNKKLRKERGERLELGEGKEYGQNILYKIKIFM